MEPEWRTYRGKYGPPRKVRVDMVGKVKSFRIRPGDFIMTSSGKLVPVTKVMVMPNRWRAIEYNGNMHYYHNRSLIERAKRYD